MNKREYIKGLISGAMAYWIWGLLPLYWKLVDVLGADQIFAQRIVWSFVFLTIILISKGQFKNLIIVFSSREKTINGLMCMIFISINWFTYIWAVNNGFVIEASLGYFINPLVSTALGALVFKEKLNKLQGVGFIIASVGVIYLTFNYSHIPVISLVLAFSFALYGVFKKKSKLDSIVGLSFETLILGVPALAYIIFSEISGNGFTGNASPIYWFIISLSGIATSIPLLLYAESVKRLPLGIIGFMQYMSPTISLILGIFVFKEVFDSTMMVAFIMIWIALIFYSIDQYRTLNTKKDEGLLFDL